MGLIRAEAVPGGENLCWVAKRSRAPIGVVISFHKWVEAGNWSGGGKVLKSACDSIDKP